METKRASKQAINHLDRSETVPRHRGQREKKLIYRALVTQLIVSITVDGIASLLFVTRPVRGADKRSNS